jgi:imidazolonepropionase
VSERPPADLVLAGASELVTCAGPAPAKGEDQSRVAVLPRGALAAREGKLIWVGPEDELDAAVDVRPGARRIDAAGRAVLPGFVDAHTHLVWGGDRADEFEQRLAGVGYSEIAAAGGGILRTVEATRTTSREELSRRGHANMLRLTRHGVTAVEVKSGYGLDTGTELKMLEAARDAARDLPLELVTTFLGAHTLPREARGSEAARREYVDLVCDEMIPLVASRKLASFVDVFVDANAFTLDEGRRVLEAGAVLGLRTKVHADQLAADGGAELAAEVNAASADHLEHVSDAGLEALARAGTVAVLLPGACLCLRSHDYADARRMVDAGVAVGLATDLNPGSSPCESMPLMLQLACLYCGLSIDEAIVAATLNAAAACGIEGRAGSLEPGKRCDFVVLEDAERRQLVYNVGASRIRTVVAAGEVVHEAG